MTINRLSIFFCLFAALISGCARYNALALGKMNPELIRKASAYDGVIVVAKVLSKEECKSYLDRDVVKQGYQPVQLYIENLSDKSYFFSPNRINIPLASPEEVAQKVHTSTMGRVLGYSAVAVLATPLFFIPAVLDGYRSSKANVALDDDFCQKAARDDILNPHSQTNMLLFVPEGNLKDTLTITLLDEETHKPKRITTEIQGQK